MLTDTFRLAVPAVVLMILFGGDAMIWAGENTVIGQGAFEKRTYRDAQGAELPYLWLAPAKPSGNEPSGHPLLVFLHGRGERGTDNQAQLTHGEAIMRSAAVEHGAFVLVPQCPPKRRWNCRKSKDTDRTLTPEPSVPLRMVSELIRQLKKDHPIDADRVYLMGLSMGGYGTWEFAQRWPEVVAAIVPICGGGDVARASRLARVPIWAFHGAADSVVPVSRSRDMIRAVREAGGKPKYTEYDGVDHDSWRRAFAEPGLLEWLFAQRRPGK